MSLYRNAVWLAKGIREYTKGGFQNASKSFNISDLDVDISQRSFMITGANSGIGQAAARAIAKKGGIVHIVCRNQERGEAALRALKEESGNEKIFLHLLDLSKPRDIKAFSAKFKDSGSSLNVLINNAGVLGGDKREATEDGLETTFATNTLGVHVLTQELLPVLEKGEDPRVITVSSGGMLVQKLNIDDLQFEKMSPFDASMAYAQTKRQEVVMTSVYAKMYPKIHFSSMHPGWADTPGVQKSLPGFYEKMKNRLRSEDEGADTIVWLAISPSAVKYESGLFFQDRKPVSTHLPLAWTKSNPSEETRLIDILNDMSKQYQITDNINSM